MVKAVNIKEFIIFIEHFLYSSIFLYKFKYLCNLYFIYFHIDFLFLKAKKTYCSLLQFLTTNLFMLNK